MPVIATYGIAGADAGILAIAFPQVRVLRGLPFWPFIPDQRVIVFSEEDPFPYYPEKEVIQIRSGAELHLDTRMGFLRFLASTGVKASDAQLEALLDMEDPEFWNTAKLATIFGSFPMLANEKLEKQKGAVYRLYSALFEDFGPVYREYVLLEQTMSQKEILAAVMTMVQKSRTVDRRGGISPFYRRILLKNRRFDRLFSRQLLQYLRSDQTKWCLLGFFFLCSAHTRSGD